MREEIKKAKETKDINNVEDIEIKYVHTKYGDFSESQITYHIKQIQKMIFWALLYADPKTSDRYPEVDIADYLQGIIRKIVGFNSMMSYPDELVSVVAMLESALKLMKSDDYNFYDYRKLILDAGATAGKMKVGE